jgi:hypothetical protein
MYTKRFGACPASREASETRHYVPLAAAKNKFMEKFVAFWTNMAQVCCGCVGDGMGWELRDITIVEYSYL